MRPGLTTVAPDDRDPRHWRPARAGAYNCLITHAGATGAV